MTIILWHCLWNPYPLYTWKTWKIQYTELERVLAWVFISAAFLLHDFQPYLRWRWKLVTQSLRYHGLQPVLLLSVHGILQARILESVAISFSRGSSQLGDRTQVSHLAGRFFSSWSTKEALIWNGGTIFLQPSVHCVLSSCMGGSG